MYLFRRSCQTDGSQHEVQSMCDFNDRFYVVTRVECYCESLNEGDCVRIDLERNKTSRTAGVVEW